MRALALAIVVVGSAGCAEEGSSAVAVDATSDAWDASDGWAPDTVDEPVELPPLVYAPCASDEHIGGFTLTLDDEYTGFNGQVSDGIVPSNIPETVAEVGSCRLLQKHNLFCETPCVPGETCGFEGVCIAYPESRDVGLVTVTGLLEPLSIEVTWGNHYTNPGTMVHPGFETGADIGLSAAGADLEPFQLRGYGVPPLTVTSPSVSISADAATELTWTAPTAASSAQVHLELNVNNHGSTSAWIACDVEDSGSFILPAALISELYAIGVSGFPSLSVTRRSVDSAALDLGCVDLVVSSARSVAVELDGVTSCTQNHQCPQGQSCGADLQCQ